MPLQASAIGAAAGARAFPLALRRLPRPGGLALLVAALFAPAGLAPQPAAAQVFVSPKGSTLNPPANSQQVATFNIQNSTPNALTFNLTHSCTGAVTMCSLSTSSITVPAFGNSQGAITVSYRSGAVNSTGRIRLGVSGAVQDSAWYNVSVPNPFAVEVTPKGQTVTSHANTTRTQTFTIRNSGSSSAMFNLSVPTCNGVDNCSVSPTSVSLSAGASSNATLSYTTRAPGSPQGMVQMLAHHPNASDVGSINVVLHTYGVDVTPKGQAVTVTAGTQQTQSFTIRNTGNVSATFNLVRTCTGVSNCSQSASSITLGAGATGTASVTYTAGAGGSTGSVQLRATHSQHSAVTNTGSINVTAISYAVDVTPKGQAVTRTANTATTQSFTVRNNGSHQATFNISHACSGSVTSCSRSASTLTLNSGATGTVTVTYTPGGGGSTGTVQLIATHSQQGSATSTGSINVTAISYAVDVTPKGQAVSVMSGSQQTQSFTVRNNGSHSATFNLSHACSGGVSSCSRSPASLTLNPGTIGTATVTYTAGAGGSTGTVQLTATHSQQVSTANTGSINVTVVAASYTVAVTPKGATTSVPGGSTQTYRFTVRNNGNSSATYTLNRSCTGEGVSNCTGPTSVTVAPGASQLVDIGYTAVSGGTSGRIRLSASHASAPTDSGWVSVTLTYSGPAPRDPVVEVQSVNPLANHRPDLCLRAAIVANASYECGHLRISHALPSVQTLNRARTPVLTYNSGQAHYFYLMAANVTLPTGSLVPDSVVGIFFINGAQRDRGRWAGNGWAPGETRRIAFSKSHSGLGTDLREYSVEVSFWFGTNRTVSTVSGDLVTVGRSSSPFGAGWWLAGLEELHQPASDSTTRLWIGGDGATRVYRKINNTTWAAPNVDRPDTLKWNATWRRYIRSLPGGVEIRFDSIGRHAETVNRLGHVTQFSYAGTTRQLFRITLPVHSGTAPYYEFVYSNGRLASVSSPGDGSRRTTRVWHNGTRVDSIRDPDGGTVGFRYSADWNYITRLFDRTGTSTRLSYGGGANRLSLARVDSEGFNLQTSFTPAETRGISTTGTANSVALASTFTLVDGPRTDVNDHTRFWVDRFGAPAKIRNAVGDSTVITRDNPSFPALVTALRHPNGFRQVASYNPRGNLSRSIAINPYGKSPAQNDTTEYAYGDPNCPDFATRVTTPEKVRTDTRYDSFCRIRQQFVANDSTSGDVRYTYHPTNRLVETVSSPIPAGQSVRPVETYTYDGTLGNLRTTTTQTSGSLTFNQTFHRDALGRDTLREASSLASVRTHYDLMHRDTLAITFGIRIDQTGRVPVQRDTLRVFTKYNANGQPLQVRRVLVPNPNMLSGLTESWEYDAVGRVAETRSSAGGVELFAYDAAGNVRVHRPRDCHASACEIRHEYDALNRVRTSRFPERRFVSPQEPRFKLDPLAGDKFTLPEDLVEFTYDVSGMRTANNREARIRRSYYPNGQLRTDSTSIRDYDGATFGTVFGTEHVYDRDGRAFTMRYPVGTAPGASSVVQYRWNPRGALQRIEDLEGLVFTYDYDPAGNVRTYSMPGNLTESRTYDLASRLRTRSGARRWSVTYGLDVAGRLGTFTGNGTFSANYTGLGGVAVSQGTTFEVSLPPGMDTNFDLYEIFSLDPLGNVAYSQTRTRTQSIWDDPLRETYNTYTPSGALASTVSGDSVFEYISGVKRSLGFRTWNDATFGYDGAGNRTATSRWARLEPVEELGQPFVFWTNILETARMYYDWAGRLRVVDQRKQLYRFSPSAGGIEPRPWESTNEAYEPGAVFEEFRYDALGRRVTVRSRPADDCPTRCRPHYDIFLWSGDQLLHEVRRSSPGGGIQARVTYTHGPGIDAPVSLIRDNGTSASAYTMVLHADRKGLIDLGTFANGERVDPLWHDWAGFNGPLYPRWPSVYTGPRPLSIWTGSLVTNKTDGNGLVYMRNRYYDPVSGQFTQEDPIGLAGGLNLYGYAGGDPVNFSDPFGLSPCTNVLGRPVCLPAWTGAAARGIAGAVARTAAGAASLATLSSSRDPGLDPVLVVHYTSVEFAAAIERSGALNAGSFVALPAQTAGMSAAEVEDFLEIQPGRGAMHATFEVARRDLATPYNGPTTSGGAAQFQIRRPVRLRPGTFTPTRPGPDPDRETLPP